MIVIKTPVLTEKTLAQYKDQNKVAFEVNVNANKDQIKSAIESSYGVSILNVKTVNRLGKKKENKLTRKMVKKTSDKKFALAELKKGDKITIFEGK